MNVSDLERALVNADAAGDAEAARVIAMEIVKLRNQPQAKPQSQDGSIANSLMQGATLGWGDELLAGAMAPLGAWQTGQSIPEAYRGIKEQINLDTQAFQERNPGTALAAEVLGGMATGGVGGLRAGGAAMLRNAPKYVRYGAAGAGTGAVAGAGYSQGETLGEVATDTAVGTALGAGLGVAVPAAANTIKGVYQKAGEALGKPERHIDRKIAEALERDEMTPDMLRARMNKMGSEGTIADAAGENTLGLLRASAAVPGQTKNRAQRILEQRQMAQGDRIKDSLTTNLSPSDDAVGELEKIFSRMRARSGPAYAAAEGMPIPFTDKLKGLLQRPTVVQALKGAERNAADEGRKFPQILQVKPDGTVDIKDVPDMRAWNDIKKSLDDIIQDNTDAITGKMTADGRRANILKQELIGELDTLNPQYKQARAIFESEAKLKTALERGQKFIAGDADISFKAVRSMSDAEKEVFRIGVAKTLRDKINKSPDGADAYKRIFGNKDVRNKLRMAFPDSKSFRQFQADMLREKKYFETRYKATGNSQTARIEGEKADAVIDPGILSNLLRGDVRGAAMSAIPNMMGRASLPSSQLRDGMASALLSKDPAQVNALLNRLSVDPSKQIERMNLIMGSSAVGGGGGLFGYGSR